MGGYLDKGGMRGGMFMVFLISKQKKPMLVLAISFL